MKINNSGIANTSVNGKEPVQATSAPARNTALGAAGQASDVYIPSQEWLRIQSLLHQQPDVRADRVAIASERLSSGYYLTNESAQKTATAMVGSLD
jgi:hypothetical protein